MNLQCKYLDSTNDVSSNLTARVPEPLPAASLCQCRILHGTESECSVGVQRHLQLFACVVLLEVVLVPISAECLRVLKK